MDSIFNNLRNQRNQRIKIEGINYPQITQMGKGFWEEIIDNYGWGSFCVFYVFFCGEYEKRERLALKCF